jgi:hypothetical protein
MFFYRASEFLVRTSAQFKHDLPLLSIKNPVSYSLVDGAENHVRSEPPTPTSSASPHSLTSIESLPPHRTPPSMHQNTIVPDAKWPVQKYGGTSVGKFASQIAENIVPYAADSLAFNYSLRSKLSCENFAATTWIDISSPLSAQHVLVPLKLWTQPTCSSV